LKTNCKNSCTAFELAQISSNCTLTLNPMARSTSIVERKRKHIAILLALLVLRNKKPKPERLRIPAVQFSIADYDDADYRKFFRRDILLRVNLKHHDCHSLNHYRFNRADILQLVDLLHLPSIIITDSRVRASAVETLCMLLRRMTYPNRYQFGRPALPN
jgi:hypothetical protein